MPARRLRRRIGWLSGIDLSPAMIAEAARKGVYDELAMGDLTYGLGGEAESCDLVTAADVLIYLGDLAPVFAGVARALVPSGLFAFSVQSLKDGAGGPGWALGEDMRYHHSRGYLEALAAANNLRPAHVEAVVCRCDRGLPVDGLLFILSKPEAGLRSAPDFGDDSQADDGLLPN
ncbi:MAG: methyltransferase domain-containing protein [Hyphomicrobiales bacterium]